MLICQCPAGAALPTIPEVTCGQSFGQIQKIAFQRIFSAVGTKNSFTAEADIKALASWQTKLSASDGTKITVSPFLEAPTHDGGDPITFGGGNDTLDGIERILGANPTNMTFALRECPQEVAATIKQLACERELGVFLFNEAGQIGALSEDGETFSPIPIKNLFVGDLIFGGFATPDSNAVRFSFPSNYSDKFQIVTPTDFNPLLDLRVE